MFSLAGFWGLEVEEMGEGGLCPRPEWMREVCGGGGTRHLMSCSKSLTVFVLYEL